MKAPREARSTGSSGRFLGTTVGLGLQLRRVTRTVVRLPVALTRDQLLDSPGSHTIMDDSVALLRSDGDAGLGQKAADAEG